MTDVLANPFIQTKAAARGDVDAMRALADHTVALVRAGGVEPCRTLSEGLVFARMAAAVGTDADKGRVAGMLALLGTVTECEWLQREIYGEAMAVMSLLADSGTESAEIAGDAINHLADYADPEALELAKIYAAAMKEAANA